MNETTENRQKPRNKLGTLAVAFLIVVDLAIVLASAALTFMAPLFSLAYVAQAALLTLLFPHQLRRAVQACGGRHKAWSRILLFTATVGFVITLLLHLLKSAEPEKLSSANLAALVGLYFLMSLIRWAGTLVFLYPIAAWIFLKGDPPSKRLTRPAVALNTLSLGLLYFLEGDFLSEWAVGIGGFWAVLLPLGAGFGFAVGAYFVWLTAPEK